MSVLWCLLLLGGLGLVFGILLAFAAKVFYVKEDPRIGEVEKMLPNANCGACGYAGCHAMAEALVSGACKKASTCKVGKKDKNFDPIIAYLATHPDEDGTKHVPSL